MIEVELPDGTIVEFPEGTDKETMKQALARYAKAPAQSAAPLTMQERYARAGIDASAPDPTDGNSFMQNAAEGMGQSLYATGRGVQQLFGRRSEEQVAEDRRRDAPLLDTAGGLSGNIVGQMAQIAAPIPGSMAARVGSTFGRAAPYVGAATRAGAFGGAQSVGEGESRAANSGMSAALGVAGQGVASGLGALSRGAISRLDDTTAGLARRAEQFGLRLGLPNLSDNSIVRIAVDQMERLPFSGAAKRNSRNQDAFNTAVGKNFGAEPGKLTPEIFAKARTALSNGFETLTNRNNLRLNTTHVNQIKGILDEASRLGGDDTARMARGWASELMGKVDADGIIPGKAYQSFDSRIGKVIKTGGEPSLYLGMLRDTVRGAMDESITPMDSRAWQGLRQGWAAMKTVEPLVAKSATGDISPALLMGRMTADGAGKTRMATGRAGEMGELARVGQRFLKPSPNSGTADRALVNAAVGGGLYGAQQQGWIAPQTALLVGGGLLGNRALLSAVNSRGLAMGGSRTLNGLARAGKTAPRLLPAVALPAAATEVEIKGGRVGTPEEIAEQEEWLRRYKAQRGQ